MKKTLSFLMLICLIFGGAKAQKMTQVLTDQALKVHKNVMAEGKANPDKGIKEINEFITFFDSQPKAVKDSVKYLRSNRLYLLTQLYALKNDTANVINSFTNSLNCGFNDWKWFSKNRDLQRIVFDDPTLALRLDSVRLKIDYLYMLQKSGAYDNSKTESYQFRYAAPTDTNLMRLKAHFNLDSVAGNGDELTRIKNLMSFIHNLVPHDGNNPNPNGANMMEDVKLCKANGTGANCRGLARMLHECYLAMGFKARYVTCFPKEYISDCHVINVVWSETLKKWLWVDPSFEAFVTDENGNMLSIAEVRDRLINNKDLILNDYANWNHKNKQNKEYYLDIYMCKNLYYLSCATDYGYNMEKGNKARKYILLSPTGYTPDTFDPETDYITNNADYFWQAPL